MFRRILAALVLLVTFGVAAKATPVVAASGCSAWTTNSGRTVHASCVDLNQGDPAHGHNGEYLQSSAICTVATMQYYYGPPVTNDGQDSSFTCPNGWTASNVGYIVVWPFPH